MKPQLVVPLWAQNQLEKSTISNGQRGDKAIKANATNYDACAPKLKFHFCTHIFALKLYTVPDVTRTTRVSCWIPIKTIETTHQLEEKRWWWCWGWGAVGPRVCSSGTRKWIAELISWEQMQFEWSASLTHMFGPPTYEKTKLESHTASMATIIYTFKWTFSFISHARTKMQLDDGFLVHNVFFFWSIEI